MYIKTERLVLKEITDKDQDALIGIFKNDIVKETYMLPDFKNDDEAIRLFKRFKELSMIDDRYVVGIYKDDELIGFMNDVEIKERKIEMGYVIEPKHHNRGYATEAFKAVINKLFESGFEEVVTGAFEINRASEKVMIKCGMNKCNYTEGIEYRGKIYNCIYYSIKNKCS